MEATQRFSTPLWHISCALAAVWDEQKRLLSVAHGPSRLLFVPPPVVERSDVSALLSADKVHPNSAGYARWGEHIAQAVAAQIEKLPGVALCEPLSNSARPGEGRRGRGGERLVT
jgi:hypothetical protein